MKLRIPKIKINVDCYQRIMTWVLMTKAEISGMGLVEEEDNGDFRITEVFLPKQHNTTGTTELDGEDLAALYFELHQRDEDNAHEKLKFWWHSHNTMGVFWSSTDEQCVKDIGGDRYLISSVFNHKSESKTRIDIFNPFKITVDELPLEIDFSKSFHIYQECKELYDEKVTERMGVTKYTNGKRVSHLPGKTITTYDRNFQPKRTYQQGDNQEGGNVRRIYPDQEKKPLAEEKSLLGQSGLLTQEDIEELIAMEEARYDHTGYYSRKFTEGYLNEH